MKHTYCYDERLAGVYVHPLNCQCTSTQRVPLPLFCMTFSYKCVSEKSTQYVPLTIGEI